MFRSFGHQSSSIIDGGLPRWAEEDLSIETTEPTQPQPTHYPAPNLNEEAIKCTLHVSLDFSFLSHLVLQVTIKSYQIQSVIPPRTQTQHLSLMQGLEAGTSDRPSVLLNKPITYLDTPEPTPNLAQGCRLVICRIPSHFHLIYFCRNTSRRGVRNILPSLALLRSKRHWKLLLGLRKLRKFSKAKGLW